MLVAVLLLTDFLLLMALLLHAIGQWLSDCHFFLLSNYWNIEYCISEFKELSDIGSRPQSIRLSDIGLRKNYWLPISDVLYDHLISVGIRTCSCNTAG
jgi:hypothetical protein